MPRPRITNPSAATLRRRATAERAAKRAEQEPDGIHPWSGHWDCTPLASAYQYRDRIEAFVVRSVGGEPRCRRLAEDDAAAFVDGLRVSRATQLRTRLSRPRGDDA